MEEDTNKKKSPKSGMFVAAIIVLVAIVVIVLAVRGKGPSTKRPEKPVNLTADQMTQALIEERMNDKEYRALLSRCQAEQAEIAGQASDLQTEINEWVDSHEKAKALSSQLASLQKNAGSEAEIASAREKLEKVMRADSEGKRLLERQDALEQAFKEARAKTADIIGARIRIQTGPKADSKSAR